MNQELATVHKWTAANKMTVNSQKPHCLVTPPKKDSFHIKYFNLFQ